MSSWSDEHDKYDRKLEESVHKYVEVLKLRTKNETCSTCAYCSLPYCLYQLDINGRSLLIHRNDAVACTYHKRVHDIRRH